MTVWPWDISGLHPERMNANEIKFFSMELANGDNNPLDSIRFNAAASVVLNNLGPFGRDKGAWPAVVSVPTNWQFYACKDPLGILPPMLMASQAISYSTVDFTNAVGYDPFFCRKLPFGLSYDISIGFRPFIYMRDGSVMFTCFDDSGAYDAGTIVGNGLFQIVDLAKFVPDAYRVVEVQVEYTRVSGSGGTIHIKPGSGVSGPGEPVMSINSTSPTKDRKNVVQQTNSYRQIAIDPPIGVTAVVRVKRMWESEMA